MKERNEVHFFAVISEPDPDITPIFDPDIDANRGLQMEKDTAQKDDVMAVAHPKRLIFGWSTWLTLIGAYCGGYVAGLLGTVLVGGLLLFLTRWRKAQITAALVLIPVLFIVGSVLRTEQINRRAVTHRLAQTAQENVPQQSPVMQQAMEAAQPADDDWNRVTSAFEQAHPDLKLGNNAAMMQDAVNRLVEPDISTSNLLEKAYAAATLTAGWTPVEVDSMQTKAGSQVTTKDWRTIQWNADVARMIADFPEVTYARNQEIFQEKINLLATSDMTNRIKLETAYRAASADAGWEQRVAIDQSAEAAKWGNDLASFLRAHPDLGHAGNKKILLEYVGQLTRPGLTNVQILELAYRVSEADRRWTIDGS